MMSRPPEALDGAVHQGRDRRLLGDVDMRRRHPLVPSDRARPPRPRRPRRRCRPDDAGAALEQRRGGGEPDATGGAGHDRNAVLECAGGHLDPLSGRAPAMIRPHESPRHRRGIQRHQGRSPSPPTAPCWPRPSEPVAASHPRPGWWEVDATEVLAATRRAITAVARDPAVRRDPPTALAISASGREVVPVDADGTPLGPLLRTADSRAATVPRAGRRDHHGRALGRAAAATCRITWIR